MNMKRYDQIRNKIDNARSITTMKQEGMHIDMLYDYALTEKVHLKDIQMWLTECFEEYIMDSDELTTKQKVMKLSRYYIVA